MNETETKTMPTVVYSKPNCPSCVKAKMLLKNKNIPFTESIIGKDIQVETLMKEFEMNNLPMPRTAPQIILHGKYVGGYENLLQYIDDHGLGYGGH
jgi:glutaredoxin 3|tara:strand:+ start:259 stop:546 length:288 start_codon:yes stop_codon:yes gene_type:complete